MSWRSRLHSAFFRLTPFSQHPYPWALEAVCQNVWMEIVLKLVTMSLVSAAQLKIVWKLGSGWVWILGYIHVQEACCEQQHVLGDWFWILFAVKKGGAKPWWIAVVSGCDVGDGDFGSFSPTLCTSAGLVPVWHCSWMTCCVWKGKWLSHVEPLQAELLKSQVLTCFCNIFQRVQSCCWCRSCRWTISSVPASSVLWPNTIWC